jgi:hypothetical protein
MVKESFSPEYDQHDPKVFRESLGSFGTTTKPGGNQLQELQTKIRQGVKHVELHLASKGKGQFGEQDVPDKYGYEQRRTIMQLAKLNKQTLSVHGSFDIVSLSGLNRQGLDESDRASSIKEIDETIKFAAETAKGGAVVFHLQGDDIATNRSEQNLSKKYLEFLKNNSNPRLKKEYEYIKENYLIKNPMKRKFVENIDLEKETKQEFNELEDNLKQKYIDLSKKSNLDPWEEYYNEKRLDKIKLAPDMNPLIVVGDKIENVDRKQEFIDVNVLKGNGASKLDSEDRIVLKSMGIDLNKKLNIDDFQKLTAYFTNGIPREFKNKITQDSFQKIRSKILVEYGDVLEKNSFLQAQADKVFFDKLNNTQIELAQMQKDRLEVKYQMYKEDIKKIRELEEENRDLVDKLDNLNDDNELDAATRDIIREDIAKRNQSINTIIYNVIGINEYSEISRYDEQVAQINKQIHDLKKTTGNTKALTDVLFEKNTSAIAHLGIKALRYQIDLKNNANMSEKDMASVDKEIESLEKKYQEAKSEDEKTLINEELMKQKYKKRLYTGRKDYADIDIKNNPLYIAPENMIAGYGSLSSLEEYKATIRISQDEFAKKILSKEPEYKRIKEEYEKLSGDKINTYEKALELAKKHIGGTFDNAHAGTWLKYFKKKKDESEENRIDRFNKWLNTQAEEMVKEGLIKHIHFNDSQGKDDDHNLLGSGILDIHDLRKRLRNAGVKEPLIVEAGGRGPNAMMHILNAFDIFNPGIRKEGYHLISESSSQGSGVSDWVNVKRTYENRVQYSQYGMSYNTFRHQPPEKGQPKGDWSGTGFL